MPLINFQPNPKIPPIGFFEPISVDPKDMMTDVEFLLGVVKKLNQMIAQINSNTEWIEKYNDKIEQIEAEILALRQEMTAFEDHIERTIEEQFTEIKIQLQSMIAAALNQANAYTDSIAAQLENEIQQIVIGNITVFDPSTGYVAPLQSVIDNLYNLGRTDALTASEYDALDLTATAYDAYELTAFQYDQNGKSLLV